MRKFAYKKGYFSKLPAEVAGDIVSDLVRQHGKAEPEELLKDKRARKAFEWDNDKAGHEYRLEQARRLLRSLVEIEVSEPSVKQAGDVDVSIQWSAPRIVNEYRHVSSVGGYISTDEISKRPDVYAEVIDDIQKQVRQCQAALDRLIRFAQDSEDSPDIISKITVAMKAFDAAEKAVMAMH